MRAAIKRKRTKLEINKKLRVTYRPVDHSRKVVSCLMRVLAKRVLQNGEE